jgi:hypothetical protein
MRYLIYNEKTEKTFTCNYQEEIQPIVDEQLDITDAEEWDISVNKDHACKGCQEYEDGQKGVQERHDAHGITTGHYCEDCYEDNYPYRKDKYPTLETHGYGERLSEDY